MHGSGNRTGAAVSVALLGATICGIGCNLIAGIESGVLVDASPDRRGTSTREGGTDATAAGDGSTGADATIHGDGGKSDAGTDAAQQTYACSPPTNIVQLLSLGDAGLSAGQKNFSTPYVVSGPFGDPVIVTQLNASSSRFIVFEVTGSNGLASVQVQALAAQGGLQLYDVQNQGNDPTKPVEVLTSYTVVDGSTNNGGGSALQIVTMPSARYGNNSSLSDATIDVNVQGLARSASNTYSAAAFVDLPTGAGRRIGYLAAERGAQSNGNAVTLAFGIGPDGGESTVHASDGGTQGGNSMFSMFFASGTTMYDVTTPSVVPTDGGVDGDGVVIATSDTLGGTGVRGLVYPPTLPKTGISGLFFAHASTLHPGSVLLFGLEAVVATGTYSTLMGTVPVTKLGGLVVGDPAYFNKTPLSSIPFTGNSGSAWNGNDELVIAGGDSQKVGLIWIAPDGHKISLTSFPGQGGNVTGAGVSFSSSVSTTFNVAWTEEYGPENSPSEYEVLYFATLACDTPIDGG